MSSQIKNPRLFALLVGINNYNDPIPPLQGCIHDLESVSKYLQKENKFFEVSIKKLMDKEATKEAIVTQFKQFLSKASEGDVAFFYFSGHGTQEEADPVFWNVEEDRKLEALVCYDSYIIQDGETKINLLADKELRYLIHQISENNAHILTVFDCCHSGGNTRNGYISQYADEIRERRFINRERISHAFPARSWQNFIFSDAISYEEVKKYLILKLLPEGKHIQLAACQNDQSAFEVKGEGVFTKNLLEVLTRCEGVITYYDLKSRIQQYLKNQFDQNPRVYVAGDDESNLFLGFLNKKAAYKPMYGNISYNLELGWIMDLGAMHGVSSQSTHLKVLSLDEKQTYNANIQDVHSTYCKIIFEEDPMDQGAILKGYPTDYFSHPIGVFFDILDKVLMDQLLKLISNNNPNLHIMKELYEADYCVHFKNGELYISKPGMPAIPIIKPVKYVSENAIIIIKNHLDHLSQYEFVMNLYNPDVFLLRSNPVEIHVLLKEDLIEKPVPIKQEELILNYNNTKINTSGTSIRISLKNRSDRKLYCALLYLSFNFEVSVKLLKEVVVGLDPNREVWALDGASIGLTLEEEIQKYNYPESVNYIKLIVSTTDFKDQITRFELPPLPGPFAVGTKGFEIGVDAYNPGNIEDWTTRLITVRIKNPEYQPLENT